MPHKEIKFVTFDLTNFRTAEASAAFALQFGIENFFELNGKTGFILLIDAESKKKVVKFQEEYTTEEMEKLVKLALGEESIAETATTE